jgi:PPOX class probable F420-dependent enzyme
MGVKLTHEEALAFLESAHTGILTTLRRDGWPVSLPVWFALVDGVVHVRTPRHTKKVARLASDSRVSFLAESGLHWKELKAVVVTGRGVLVDDPALRERVDAALDAKYAGFRTPRTAMPSATREHYEAGHAWIRVEPTGPFLTWDNAKLRLRA